MNEKIEQAKDTLTALADFLDCLAEAERNIHAALTHCADILDSSERDRLREIRCRIETLAGITQRRILPPMRKPKGWEEEC